MNLIFSNPFFLYLLPAASLPIILHLISRGKPLKLFFPSIRFIKLGKVPSHEKRTLTDILLLIIRVLLLLFLVLFFAGPEIKKDQTTSEHKKCAIVFDTSISSFHKNYFPALIEKITSELNQLSNQTDFLVINSAHQMLDSVKTNNKNEVISYLNKLSSHNTSPNHRQGLQEASNFIGNDKGTLMIASVFDIAGFEQINKINFNKDTKIICLKTEVGKQNINILGVQFGKNNSEINAVRLSAKLLNDGLTEFNGEIKISFAGKTETKNITLKPAQAGTVVFNVDIPPDSLVVISTDNADDYSPDNTYYCKSPQIPLADFLLLKPQKTISNESIFMEETLKVSNINMIKINYQSMEAEKFNPAETKPPHFLMLSGCADLLTTEQITAIRDWHKLGTHLIITPSEDYRKGFSVLSNSGIITQNAISKFSKSLNAAPVFFNNINEKSTYTNIFIKDGVNDFISIPIHQYVRLQHLKNTEILLTTENEDPILLINRLGGGICFVFTIGLDPFWSDLPLTSTFLPLIRQMINVSYQNNYRKTEEFLLPGTFVKTTKEDDLYLYNGGQKKIADNEKGKLLELLPPGVYQMSSQTYIVNNSRKHSRPDLLSAFELKNTLLAQSNNAVTENNAENKNDSLKKYLLYAIFLFIFLEIFLHTENSNRKKEVMA